MLKNTLIIALVIVIIYLYYQQKKQNHLINYLGPTNETNLNDLAEVKKVNQILADFCKNEIGGQDINEIRTKLNGRTLTKILEENDDYETTTDELKRTKGELEAEITTLTNSWKNRVGEKERIITRLTEEKQELDKKYKKKSKQLDEEQLEHKKTLTQLETLTQDLTNTRQANQKLFKEQAETNQERDNFKNDLNSILNKWHWDGKYVKSSKEFISEMEPWIKKRTEEMEELKNFCKKHKIESLKDFEEQWENKEKDYLKQIEQLKTSENNEIISKSEAENKNLSKTIEALKIQVQNLQEALTEETKHRDRNHEIAKQKDEIIKEKNEELKQTQEKLKELEVELTQIKLGNTIELEKPTKPLSRKDLRKQKK